VDGATGVSLTFIPLNTVPFAIAVNPVTNRVFVSEPGGHRVTIIRGSDNTALSSFPGTFPQGVVVDAATNTVYFASSGALDGTLESFDATTFQPNTVALTGNPVGLAVNHVTRNAYAISQHVLYEI